MKRGPKPKPKALKLLEGVHPFRVNYDEPEIRPGSTAGPAWLTGLALEHWNELAPSLGASRILADVDRANLALLCLLYQRWRLDNGDRKAIDQYVRLSLEFGLTPSSRSRIKAPPEKLKDALGEFLEANKA